MGINFRSVIFINGIVVCGLALAMAVPMLFDLFWYSGKCVGIFAPSILASIFLGGCFRADPPENLLSPDRIRFC